MIPALLPLTSMLLSTSPAPTPDAPRSEAYANLFEAAIALDPRVTPQQDDEAAELLSYTFVEVGATQTNLDEVDSNIDEDEVDSYYGTVSLNLFSSNFFLFGTYENLDFDFEDTNSDLFELGAGVHFPVGDKLDLVGTAAWLLNDVSSDLDELDDSEDGYELGAGARWIPIGWDGGGLEINGRAVWITLDNRLGSDDELFGWEAGARLHFLRVLSFGATYALLEDDDQVLANARFAF